MILNVVFGPTYSVKHQSDVPQLNLDATLLPDLAHGGVGYRLAILQMTAGNTPRAFMWRFASLHQEDLVASLHYDSNRHRRLSWV